MFHEELKHSAKTAFGKAKRHGKTHNVLLSSLCGLFHNNKTNRSKHTMFYPRRYANSPISRKQIKGGIWSGTLPPARRYANNLANTKSVKGGKCLYVSSKRPYKRLTYEAHTRIYAPYAVRASLSAVLQYGRYDSRRTVPRLSLIHISEPTRP